jgi:hypothetical protein
MFFDPGDIGHLMKRRQYDAIKSCKQRCQERHNDQKSVDLIFRDKVISAIVDNVKRWIWVYPKQNLLYSYKMPR